MSVQKTYAEKLLDPRWQKKRLLILQRDEWRCRRCGQDKKTLHVHHLEYKDDPWDVPDSSLLTLCVDCHTAEGKERPELEREVIKALRLRGFYSSDLAEIAEGLANVPNVHLPEVLASVISWALSSESIMLVLVETYFEQLRVKNGSIEDMPY